MAIPRTAHSLLALSLSLAACTPARLLNATISRAGLTITRDVAYGPHRREKLDIYRPRGSSPVPVVIFFYGGSWNSGSKSNYPFVAATLARQGFVVVVPDYRVYPEVRFPAFLEDCARSVAWTQAHLRDIGGDADRVFLMGHSAGAYNAVMLGMNTPYLTQAGTGRDRIAGIIGLAGPYDFLPITGADIKPIFAAVGDGPQSQPITFADGHAPPLLLLAGSADDTVRPRNTLSLAARIRADGGRVEDKIYPDIGHVGLVASIAPIFQDRAPVLEDVSAFIRAHRLMGVADVVTGADPEP
jgi:acetyl esterase/lipase